MSHTYLAVAPGELHIKAVTPVIKALFGYLNIEAEVNDKGVAKFHSKEDEPVFWDDLQGHLLTLLQADSQKKVEDKGDLEATLWALASEFNQQHNYGLMNFIDHRINGEDKVVDLDDLYFLAKCFDDWHGLSQMLFQGGWAGSQPSSLSSCGGYAGLNSERFAFLCTTQGALSLAQRIDESLQSNDLNRAACHMVSHFDGVALGVSNAANRDCIALSAALQLLARINYNVRPPLSTLYYLWDEFRNIPCSKAAVHEVRNGIKENEQLTRQRFLLFPEGTAVEAIWRWFESMDHRFVVGDVMQGKRLPDDAKG